MHGNTKQPAIQEIPEMTPETTGLLRQLVFDRPVAGLGTLHDGLPFVSLIPYAVSPDGGRLLDHISRSPLGHHRCLRFHRGSRWVCSAGRSKRSIPRGTFLAEPDPSHRRDRRSRVPLAEA